MFKVNNRVTDEELAIITASLKHYQSINLSKKDINKISNWRLSGKFCLNSVNSWKNSNNSSVWNR